MKAIDAEVAYHDQFQELVNIQIEEVNTQITALTDKQMKFRDSADYLNKTRE